MSDQSIITDLVENFILLHKNQLVSNGIPEIYWNTLFIKLKDEIFDAGTYFQIVKQVDPDDEEKCVGYGAMYHNQNELTTEDPLGIFLIDHAWTYRINEARKHLLEIDGLADRMASLMCIELDTHGMTNGHTHLLVDKIIEKMWCFNQTYKLAFNQMTDEEREPLWYIMDEFGSSIGHDNEPNVRCVPFYYLPTRTMFSVMWPLKTISREDELTRDFTYGAQDDTLRRVKLLPWLYSDCTDISIEQQEPSDDYFMTAREDETLPITFDANLEHLPKDSFKVYTDLEMVKEFLTDTKYSFVDDQSQADIVFIRKHFKDYRSLYEHNPRAMINQFPFENVITVKDLLAIVSRRVPESSKWLPVTYNLKYELPQFVSLFQQREKNELDNYWIVKPWNLARSIDMYVTNNLSQIIRLSESGPKIVCKYISNPVLFYREELRGRVKFDIRYIVMLQSVKPLRIYTYKNPLSGEIIFDASQLLSKSVLISIVIILKKPLLHSHIIFQPYSLDNLDDYEKHFTVMNYRPVNLKQINCDEFIELFEKQNVDLKWSQIEEKIFKMIRQVFEGAQEREPPKGFANNPQSRAMYAIDLMLNDERLPSGERNVEPMICECNFMPDCKRACTYHPNFFNDIFNTLFADSHDSTMVNRIC